MILSILFLVTLRGDVFEYKPPKRPELRGRHTNSLNHSMNSLRSNSISYFVAPIAIAIRDSISIQRICMPLKTSSCGMFLRFILKDMEHENIKKTWLARRAARLCRLLPKGRKKGLRAIPKFLWRGFFLGIN